MMRCCCKPSLLGYSAAALCWASVSGPSSGSRLPCLDESSPEAWSPPMCGLARAAKAVSCGATEALPASSPRATSSTRRRASSALSLSRGDSSGASEYAGEAPEGLGFSVAAAAWALCGTGRVFSATCASLSAPLAGEFLREEDRELSRCCSRCDGPLPAGLPVLSSAAEPPLLRRRRDEDSRRRAANPVSFSDVTPPSLSRLSLRDGDRSRALELPDDELRRAFRDWSFCRAEVFCCGSTSRWLLVLPEDG
mmetsp:Transcript_15328/g.42869  ORF Transcript_15328/g.42869 Transcript_15328/m.42869 type:complete len:252 (+) Transcript_15328:919-1674(+)